MSKSIAVPQFYSWMVDNKTEYKLFHPDMAGEEVLNFAIFESPETPNRFFFFRKDWTSFLLQA